MAYHMLVSVKTVETAKFLRVYQKPFTSRKGWFQQFIYQGFSSLWHQKLLTNVQKKVFHFQGYLTQLRGKKQNYKFNK